MRYVLAVYDVSGFAGTLTIDFPLAIRGESTYAGATAYFVSWDPKAHDGNGHLTLSKQSWRAHRFSYAEAIECAERLGDRFAARVVNREEL